MPNIIRHVIVTGRVQGVGYRAWTGDQAILLGLQGWVRNRRDGSVEAVFAGPKDAVMEMIELCHRGPRRRGSIMSCQATHCPTCSSCA
ncbi:acylphosphatase [Tardiphaga alba]|uniref:acylphosphatase n=1 Tax=Tardiphaga alba TaxID=340268 RepID=UPI002E1A0E47